MEDLDSFRNKHNRHVVDIASNVLLHAQMVIDDLDEIEKFGIFKHDLKRNGKLFKAGLESAINKIYKASPEEDAQKLSKIHDNYISVLSSLNTLTIEELSTLATALPQLITNMKNSNGKEIHVQFK